MQGPGGMGMNRNKRYYKNSKVVDRYSRLDGLQGPEQAFLDMYRERLTGLRLLDLGVGGGRTTLPFCSHAGEYVGVDYSQEMVHACNRRYRNLPNAMFEVGDARSLPQFPDGHFGAVLFSYNGIDEVPAEDRRRVLDEMHRLLAPSGVFFFSSHNLNFMSRLFAASFWSGPRRYLMLRAINRGRRPLGQDFGLFDDGWQNLRFRMDTYYISPQHQFKQLQEAGFDGIRAFSVESGREYEGLEDLRSSVEPWIYYLCTRP